MPQSKGHESAWARQQGKPGPGPIYSSAATLPEPSPPRHAAAHPPQEVTPLILSLLQSSDWWGKYVASDPPPGQPYFT
jgi:hypothetical protein